MVIFHTSGTTGNPKPVLWSHQQSVAGPRFRLATQREPADSVMLSALPQSHSGAVGFTFYALLAGLPLVALSNQDTSGLAAKVAGYRPTTIVAFNQTFAALATTPVETEAFRSVASWINIGDSAHDAHMRRLVRLGQHAVRGEMAPGSVFGDGLGSSELGWAALHRVFIPESPVRPGYIGKPAAIATVTVLHADGTPAADGEVGMLAVRSPSVAPGYWNDSDTYYRGRLAGY